MLPDDAMVEAADDEILTWADAAPAERVGSGQAVLSAAFAALDREALIEAGARGAAYYVSVETIDESSRACAEAVLRAVGLIA